MLYIQLFSLNGHNSTSYIFYGLFFWGGLSFRNNENEDGSLFLKLRKLGNLLCEAIDLQDLSLIWNTEEG